MNMRSPVNFYPLVRTVMALTLLLSVNSVRAQDKVVISEFMAANVRTLADRDRQYSDWIELYNPGSVPVNLDGWFLTDDRMNLKKWRFPAVPLAPNEYLVIFASNKDRRVAGAELHTNFKLNAESGYLALVKADGATLASEFGPEYPPQLGGASYGVEMSDRPAPLVTASAPKRVLVPSSDIGMTWPAVDYSDSSWLQTTGGVGFGGDATPAVPLDLRQQMVGKATTVYMRLPFEISDLAPESLRLRMRHDDGFVAYLNGWEVARTNAPAKPQWNSTAIAVPGSRDPVVLVENFDNPSTAYVTAELAAMTRPKLFVFEESKPGGCLRLINGKLTNQANGIAFSQAAPGLFEMIKADFDFRWKGSGEGTERLAFMLIPVAQYGATGQGINLVSYQESKDPMFGGTLAVQILLNAENGQKAVTVHWDRNKHSTVDLPSSAFAQRNFHHAQVQLQHTPQGAEVSVTLTSDAYGPKKQTFAPISRLVIPGLQPYQSRVQFLGRTRDWTQTIDLDNLQVKFHRTGARGAEEFDLTSHINVLRPGKNVLAIHGMNQSADDPTFLLEPELVAGFSSVGAKAGRYFATPTPRAGNREGVRTVSPPPVYLKRGGVFTGPVKLEFSARDGVVRYTLDGSEPNPLSRAYAEPITLTGSTLVKARTFVPEALPSETVTETFSFLDESEAEFSSNLPLLIINPFGQYISADKRSTVSVRFMDATKGRNSLLGAADYDGRASVNLRGFSTLRQPKNSMTLRLIDENNSKVKAGLFGMPKESDWVLYAPFVDKTLMRDALAYELSNQMGRYAPRTKFVEVFMERSGGKLGQRDYMGLYLLVEKIKRGKNRVNITELSATDTSEPDITGGYIIKRDHSESYEPSFPTRRGNHFYYVEPDPEDMSRNQMNWISSYMNQFEQALYGSDFNDPARGYAAYLDVDAFIDQHWLIEMSKNIDGFRYSAYLFKDRGGKLNVGPAWDWNLSFGNADYYDGSDPRGWYTPNLRDREISWFRRLDEDPEFQQRTIDRWGELRRTVFSTHTILARVDEMAAQLNEAQARNFRRWPVLGRRVHPNDFVGDTYEEEIKWMKQWIQKRLAWIDSQFVAPAVLSKSGATITLDASSGKIHYTLDGSDPRLPGGGVSPKAKTYSAPIPAKDAAKLFARVQNKNSWSSPVSLTYR